MTKRVAVIGAAGQLGTTLQQVLAAAGGWEIHACDRDTIDATDAPALRGYLTNVKPAWVINCVALTHVDNCETDENTEKVNAEPLATMAEVCNDLDAGLVQISTDFVFDGLATTPYTEDASIKPLNRYAQSKAASETYTQRANKHLIIRTAWLYSEFGPNFVWTMLKLAAAGKPLRVVNDQTGSPSYAPDIAGGIAKLLAADAHGIVHLVNRGQATWYELAKTAITRAKLPLDIQPIPASEYPSPAKRPAYSVLCTDRYTALTGDTLRPWPDALAAYIAAMQPKIAKLQQV